MAVAAAGPVAGALPAASAPSVLDRFLPEFGGLDPAEKVARVERLVGPARGHPSGIPVCMPFVGEDGLREVRAADFDGMDRFRRNFGHELADPVDFFNNENSITTAGSRLAAQSLRRRASGDPAARAGARLAFQGLRRIHDLSVAAGQPGFLGKPFHFAFSAHTTGDQYLHALWGLWNFLPVAEPAEQAEARALLTAMADHQMKVDYTVFNRSGGAWNNRLDPTDYNAIMAALVAAAYRVTGERRYREACAFVLRSGTWQRESRVDRIISQVRAGNYRPRAWDGIAGARTEEGEFAHWEQVQHGQFTAIAASILHECVPDLLPAEELRRTLRLWWADQPLGFERDGWHYLYWFLVSARDRSWRPVELTPRLSPDQWLGGHPLLSFASRWVYGDCLARFLWTALVVARHCPELRDEAAAFAETTFRRLEPRHLLWVADPDGRQIPPAVGYFTRFVSSELPEVLLAPRWEGRSLGLWS